MSRYKSSREISVITDVLKRIDRRIRFNLVLDHLSISICLVFGVLLIFQVGKMLFPIVPPTNFSVITGFCVLFIVFLVWSQRRGGRLAKAAVVADAQGSLRDEIKTAYWFMGEGGGSPWIDLQLKRAAGTARNLDSRRLVPTVIPRRFWLAFGLFVIIQTLSLIPIEGPLITFASAADSKTFTQTHIQRLQEIQDLINDKDGLEGEENSEILTQFEETLKELQAEQLTTEEFLLDIKEIQNALEEGNLQINSIEEALADLARDLKNSKELKDIAEAFNDEDLTQASEMMRELSKKLSSLTEEEVSGLTEDLRKIAMSDIPDLKDLLESLQEVAEAMGSQKMVEAQKSLEEAAENMEEMSRSQDMQKRRNEASRQMDAIQESTIEQQVGRQQLLGMQEGKTENAQSAEAGMAISSDEVKQSSGSTEGQDPSGPPGHATSKSMGNEQKIGSSTTLEVQLEMEIVDESKPQEDLDSEDIFLKASQQENSILDYRDINGPSNYAAGSSLGIGQIPWWHRSLVKEYFLAIRPGEKK